MSSEPSLVLETVALGKSYGAFTAVADLCLRVHRGELYALLGPNGVGKTTTLKMLMGVGRETIWSSASNEVLRRFGVAPQSRSYFRLRITSTDLPGAL